MCTTDSSHPRSKDLHYGSLEWTSDCPSSIGDLGDVGVITEQGFFDSLFNISLPCDHPLAINSDRLSDNFYPLNIMPNDIQEYSDFNQSSFLSSTSIKSLYNDDNSS